MAKTAERAKQVIHDAPCILWNAEATVSYDCTTDRSRRHPECAVAALSNAGLLANTHKVEAMCEKAFEAEKMLSPVAVLQAMYGK